MKNNNILFILLGGIIIVLALALILDKIEENQYIQEQRLDTQYQKIESLDESQGYNSFNINDESAPCEEISTVYRLVGNGQYGKTDLIICTNP